MKPCVKCQHAIFFKSLQQWGLCNSTVKQCEHHSFFSPGEVILQYYYGFVVKRAYLLSILHLSSFFFSMWVETFSKLNNTQCLIIVQNLNEVSTWDIFHLCFQSCVFIKTSVSRENKEITLLWFVILYRVVKFIVMHKRLGQFIIKLK